MRTRFVMALVSGLLLFGYASQSLAAGVEARPVFDKKGMKAKGNGPQDAVNTSRSNKKHAAPIITSRSNKKNAAPVITSRSNKAKGR